MKKSLLIFILCFAFQFYYGQETYTVNGETLQLKTEIDGKLDLLWNTFDGEYRYFVRTEIGTITELKNTKDENNDYREEYKSTLRELTGMSTDNLKLTLYSLKSFLDTYNISADGAYTSTRTERNVQLRLGFSGGITNHPFIGNPENKKTPMIGAELEVLEGYGLSRHSGFLQARHTFDNDDLSYSTTEFSLGYRFRFVNTDTFSIYGQVKFATLNFSNATFTDDSDMEVDVNETSFDIPFIFGLGSDIKVGENSYITVIYSELFAAFIDNQGNFPIDFAIGYKFNL